MAMMNNSFRHTLLISQRFVIRQTRLAAAATTVAAAAFAFYGKHFLEQQLNNPLNKSIRLNIYTYYHLENE